MPQEKTKHRCAWAGTSNPLMIRYHDNEWGVPLYDDQKLFEFLLLEGAQAGLSWEIILNKREAYQKAFDQFKAEKIARYDDKKREELLSNKGIVRNRLKVNAFINNAQQYLHLLEKHESFADFIWQFTDGEPIINHQKSLTEIPTQTAESVAMSKSLKQHGFKFIGPTICYAFMQAIGMVNDHTSNCFRHTELKPCK